MVTLNQTPTQQKQNKIISTLLAKLEKSLLNTPYYFDSSVKDHTYFLPLDSNGIEFWLEDFANDQTGEVELALRVSENFGELTPLQKIFTLKKALKFV